MTAPFLLLRPHERDIGALRVRRLLPAAQARMVGPFIFLDHMGPVTLAPGAGIDIGPHPHIGLATVTYLFSGALLHRDSLGSVQEIRPGDVNWMTAGRGIVHSERSPQAARMTGDTLHGLQIWVALPQAHEQDAASFQHCDRGSLPRLDNSNSTLILIAGQAFGLLSPVKTHSPLFYADLHLQADASFIVPAEHPERAACLIEGEAEMDGTPLPSGFLAVLPPGAPATLTTRTGARLVLLGGSPLEGPRHIWWNFVASNPALIEQAREDWSSGRTGQIPGEHDRIPLPSR